MVELLAAATAVLIVLVLVITALGAARRHEKVAACMDNLRQLHRAESSWESSHPGKPALLGKAYWLKLVKANPPLVEGKVLVCPLAPPTGEAEGCAYLGPSGDVRGYAPSDPVGLDEESNHDEYRRQGGNILRKSGEVVNDNREAWWSALRSGKCRP